MRYTVHFEGKGDPMLQREYRKAGLLLLTLVVLLGLLAGCTAVAPAAAPTEGGAATPSGERQPVTMWFWGAPPEHQETMKAVLIDPYNASQDKYELSVEFRNTVDKDISVALAANEGPD